MTPEEEAVAVRDTRACTVVPLSNGDLALFDTAGNLVVVADIRPISFGGFGMGGLLNAIEVTVNKTTSEYFRIPVRGASAPGEYWTKHQRTPSSGTHKYVPPAAVTQPAKNVTSSSQLGLVRRPK